MSNNVNHIRLEHVIDAQAAAESAMLEEFENGEFTFEAPLVKLNPYIISPQAAVILFKTTEEVPVTVTVRGKEEAGDISFTFPPAKTHILPILGLYADYENTVDIRLYQGAVKTVTIKTGPIAEIAPTLLHMKTTAQHLRKQLIVLTSSGDGVMAGFDYKGDIRWHLTIMARQGMKRLENGRILAGTDRLIKPPYYLTGLYEFDMVGKIYKEYQLPGAFHHDQCEMEDGDIVVMTDDFERGTVEDVLALIDRETGEIKKTWDFAKILKPMDGHSGLASPKDWFHSNAVWYEKETNSLTVSGRHNDIMVNVDFDTGEINWIIGDPKTWPENMQKYFFRPIGDDFEWQYAQHACLVTPCGDVMCFDNGTLRSKDKENYRKHVDNYSRGVRYRINTEDMTIRQMWQFGKELGNEFFSQHISNVEFYEDGYYLVHSGGIQYYDDVTFEGIMANKAADPRARCECQTVEVIDNEVVLDLRVAENYHRAKKLSPYYAGSNLTLGAGRKLGSLSVTPCTRKSAAEFPVAGSIPATWMAHIIEEADRVALKARFEVGQKVFFALKQGEELLCYDVDTSGGVHAPKCCVPYIPPDSGNTSTLVNKNGLAGLYELQVIIDGKAYATDVEIRC